MDRYSKERFFNFPPDQMPSSDDLKSYVIHDIKSNTKGVLESASNELSNLVNSTQEEVPYKDYQDLIKDINTMENEGTLKSLLDKIKRVSGASSRQEIDTFLNEKVIGYIPRSIFFPIPVWDLEPEMIAAIYSPEGRESKNIEDRMTIEPMVHIHRVLEVAEKTSPIHAKGEVGFDIIDKMTELKLTPFDLYQQYNRERLAEKIIEDKEEIIRDILTSQLSNRFSKRYYPRIRFETSDDGSVSITQPRKKEELRIRGEIESSIIETATLMKNYYSEREHPHYASLKEFFLQKGFPITLKRVAKGADPLVILPVYEKYITNSGLTASNDRILGYYTAEKIPQVSYESYKKRKAI